jgi:hypothetical protein
MRSVDVVALLRRAAGPGGLDAGALGGLVAMLADWLLGGSRLATLRLIVEADLEELLASPEFVDRLGKGRLKSRALVTLAFRRAASPSAAITNVLGLMSAGALNVFSASALVALHTGMRGWASVEPRAALVGGLLAELDSWADAARLLALLLGSPACEWTDGESRELLRRVLAQEDVRDLAGDPTTELPGALPEYADILEDALGAFSEGDGSEADEHGNLAEFVVGDDEVSYDSDVSGGSGDGSDDSDGAGQRGLAAGAPSRRGGEGHDGGAPPRRRQRADSAVSDASEQAPTASRKRLRRADDGAAAAGPSTAGPSAQGRRRSSGTAATSSHAANPGRGARDGGRRTKSERKPPPARASRFLDAHAGVGGGSESEDDR